MSGRVGFYCWAGPDTIRMTNLKFFNPKINTRSLMSSYDYEYLAQVKELFGITDFWATYSWGFSEESEEEQYDFLISRIENFKKLDITLHAYIQGTNLVYEDYKDRDWFCKDEKDRNISYYRGRKVVCVNNPDFNSYIETKIKKTYGLGFHGIFVDNIQMGQIPIPDFSTNKAITFHGCNCRYCNNEFNGDFNSDSYLQFKTESITRFVNNLADTTHAGNMLFGTNSFDPKFDTRLMFGVDLKQIVKCQDYILFENHSLPDKKRNNRYIEDVVEKNQLDKPVFVLSYKRGIGIDSQYSQEDFNNIYTEDKKFSFFSCIKGSEYLTNSVWHNLNLEQIKKPTINEHLDLSLHSFNDSIERFLLKIPLLRKFLVRYYNQIYRMRMENRFVRKLLGVFTDLALR